MKSSSSARNNVSFNVQAKARHLPNEGIEPQISTVSTRRATQSLVCFRFVVTHLLMRDARAHQTQRDNVEEDSYGLIGF